MGLLQLSEGEGEGPGLRHRAGDSRAGNTGAEW